MFQCQQCQSTKFKLQLHTGVDTQVTITTNEHDDVVINAGNQSFVADLSFMNRFALCADCESKKQWAYYYPDTVKP